jgi:hypothetical protein
MNEAGSQFPAFAPDKRRVADLLGEMLKAEVE